MWGALPDKPHIKLERHKSGQRFWAVKRPTYGYDWPAYLRRLEKARDWVRNMNQYK